MIHLGTIQIFYVLTSLFQVHWTKTWAVLLPCGLCAVIEVDNEYWNVFWIEEIWGGTLLEKIIPCMMTCIQSFVRSTVLVACTICTSSAICTVHMRSVKMDHTTIIQRESTICKHDFKSSCKETFVEWKFCTCQARSMVTWVSKGQTRQRTRNSKLQIHL